MRNGFVLNFENRRMGNRQMERRIEEVMHAAPFDVIRIDDGGLSEIVVEGIGKTMHHVYLRVFDDDCVVRVRDSERVKVLTMASPRERFVEEVEPAGVKLVYGEENVYPALPVVRYRAGKKNCYSFIFRDMEFAELDELPPALAHIDEFRLYFELRKFLEKRNERVYV